MKTYSQDLTYDIMDIVDERINDMKWLDNVDNPDEEKIIDIKIVNSDRNIALKDMATQIINYMGENRRVFFVARKYNTLNNSVIWEGLLYIDES